MSRWSADAVSDSRTHPRELVAELATFCAGLVVLFGSAGVQGAWFTAPDAEAPVQSSENAEPGLDTLVWAVFTGPEWPGAVVSR